MKRTLFLSLSSLFALSAVSISNGQDASSGAAAEPEAAAAVSSSPERDALIEKLTVLLEDIEANGPTFEKLDQIGDLYLQGGDVQRAVYVFQKAIADFGGTESLYLKFARVMDVVGRPQNSVDVLSLGLKEFPESEAIVFELGKAYVAAGKPYAALSNLKKVLALDPSNQAYRYHLADAYRLQKKWKEASEIIDELVEEKTELLAAYLMKADLLLIQGELSGGVRYLEDLLEEYPDSDSVKRVLVHGYQLYGYDESIAGRLSNAVATMRSALEVDPANSESQVALASFLDDLGEHEESESIFKVVLQQNPNYLDSYVLYGRMLEKLDRTPEAATIYQRGLSKSRELGADAGIYMFRELLGIKVPQ